LSARIESFELAFRMQAQAPEAFGVDGESPETKKLYGLDDPATEIFGKQCLIARRLSERGVRWCRSITRRRANAQAASSGISTAD